MTEGPLPRLKEKYRPVQLMKEGRRFHVKASIPFMFWSRLIEFEKEVALSKLSG